MELARIVYAAIDFFSANINVSIHFHLLHWKHSRMQYIRRNTKSQQFLRITIKNNSSAKRITLKWVFYIACYKYIRTQMALGG